MALLPTLTGMSHLWGLHYTKVQWYSLSRNKSNLIIIIIKQDFDPKDYVSKQILHIYTKLEFITILIQMGFGQKYDDQVIKCEFLASIA